jgi:hypothetical protein
MLEAAKSMMLEGREPSTKRDWELVMNFFAANIVPECARPACRLMAMMYDMPLTEGEVNDIVSYQLLQQDACDALTS